MESCPARSLDDVVVVVSGGLLADPKFLLEKMEDDGSLSIWAGLVDDEDPIGAACLAGPIPNGKIRTSTVGRLEDAGFSLEFSRAEGAAAPDRHIDAFPPTMTYEAVQVFIGCFDPPIENEWRNRK